LSVRDDSVQVHAGGGAGRRQDRQAGEVGAAHDGAWDRCKRRGRGHAPATGGEAREGGQQEQQQHG
jgi:hypothetical protein